MKAKDIMTTTVITVAPEASIPEVARLLLERHISAVPVLDSGDRLVGIVSEGDFLRRAEEGQHRHGSWWLRLLSATAANATEYVKTHGRSAADVMTRDVVTVTEDAPVGEVAHLLETKRIKRVPVLRDGKVVGIVSRADLLRGLAARGDIAPATASVADETIRNQIIDVIRRADWAPTYGLTVIVMDGIVHIWGIADASEQREAIRVAAENVAGVRGVEVNVSTLPVHAWAE